ncbi:DNA topoisomerase type IA zn finger domain-containing protein [Natrialba hulunbeirensis JCM 10989]|uniref:DNA topoisomerase type IA zn finger domain-containing protein n=1 Tax=Natrialba hulunbeirensis JCM 10989 TaxID=1227493 RepID=M0A1T7_9EURY|nr:endonuclease NucS domain-containing protein [Natrialba hulunbeirensis]ELY91323.1 DNA topoisomerase type IA zn finger domain-containing protein [Natrialba hulunbeirensis JCM 10989]
MIDDAIRVLAGDCTVIAEGTDRSEYRGRVTTIVKPDNTVLVHDIDGYQPVAWLTRADSVSSDRTDDFTLVAKKDTQTLRIAAHDQDGFANYPASAAGTPVGTCPDDDCTGSLVRSKGVRCVDCGTRYGVPADATIKDDQSHCECGLPRMRVERGLAFDVCLDRNCESLDEAVREAFDREWGCPESGCDGDLRILRRGGLIAGCEHYPECDTGFAMPGGVVDGECACGLPTFETRSGSRCLDATCEGHQRRQAEATSDD